MSLVPYAKRGIQNNGNTCYMNASLQMLFCVTSFRDSMKLMSERSADNRTKAAADKISKLFDNLLDEKKHNPVSVTQALRKAIMSVMQGTAAFLQQGEQAEVQEVIMPLLTLVLEDKAVPIAKKYQFCPAVNEITRCVPKNTEAEARTTRRINQHTIVSGVYPIVFDPVTEQKLNHRRWAQWVRNITTKKAEKLRPGSKVLVKDGEEYVSAKVLYRDEDREKSVTSYTVQEEGVTYHRMLKPSELALKEHISTSTGKAKSTNIQSLIDENARPENRDNVDSCDGTFSRWEMYTVEPQSQFVLIPTVRISDFSDNDETRYVTDLRVEPSNIKLWLTGGKGTVSYTPIGAILFLKNMSHYIFVRLDYGTITRIYDDETVLEAARDIDEYVGQNDIDVSKQAVFLLYEKYCINHNEELDRSTWGNVTVEDHRAKNLAHQTFGAIMSFASARPRRSH